LHRKRGLNSYITLSYNTQSRFIMIDKLYEQIFFISVFLFLLFAIFLFSHKKVRKKGTRYGEAKVLSWYAINPSTHLNW